RRFRRLSKVFADRPPSQPQFFANLAQAHPASMQLVDTLVELPLAQKTSLGFALLGRGSRIRSERALLRRRAARHFRICWRARSGGWIRQADTRPHEKAFDRLAQAFEQVPAIA